MILRSACEVICATLNADILQSEGHQRILDQYIESSMRRREPECQEAVADVFGSLGRLRGAGKEAIKSVCVALQDRVLGWRELLRLG